MDSLVNPHNFPLLGKGKCGDSRVGCPFFFFRKRGSISSFFRNILGFLLLCLLFFFPSCLWGASLKEIQHRGVLKIAITDFAISPFLFSQDSTIQGYNIDLIHRIAQELEVKPELMELPWNEGITQCWTPSFLWSSFDMVGAPVAIRSEREKYCAFSVPYAFPSYSVVVAKDSPIRTLEQLGGKKIGVTAGSTSSYVAFQYFEKESILLFPDLSACFQALSKELIEALVVNTFTAINLFQKHKSTVQILPKALFRESSGLGFVLPKGEKELLEVINRVIQNSREILDQKWLFP